MFTINQGFDLNSPQFNFKRDYFATVADLKAANENGFPDHFITNVAGVLYQLTKSNSVDTTTGKWRKVKLGSDVDLSKYGTSLGITPGDDHANSTNIDLINGNTRISSIKLKQVNTINAGLMSVADKAKLNGIAAGANNYTLPTASTTVKGGVQLGYTATGKNYPLNVDANGKAYVNVPWTDTKTDISNCLEIKNKQVYNNAITAIVSGTSSKPDHARIDIGDSNIDGYLGINNKAGKALEISPTGITVDANSPTKLFATDGSLFDASTLATKDSLSGYISNQSGIIDTSVEGNVATLTLGNSADDGNIVVNKANSDTGEISYSNTIAGDNITILNSNLRRGIRIAATNGLYISMRNGNNNPIMLDGESGEITAGRFVRKNGTSAQFLKADGSVDSNTYVKSSDVTAITEAEINALF